MLHESDETMLHAHRDTLMDGLRRIFGEFDPHMLQQVLPRFKWMVLAGGATLFEQGELDDSLYFVISGRLRAISIDADGNRRVFGDIARGETVGEVAFFTQQPRSATVIAVRESVLVRVSSEVFRQLLTAYPLMSLNLTRLVVERLQRSYARKGDAKPVTFGLLGVSPGVDLREFARRLTDVLPAAANQVLVVTPERMDLWMGRPNAAHASSQDVGVARALAGKLEQIESEHSFVVFVADDGPTEWTRRCLRHCDRVLLIANADATPALSTVEQACLPADAANHPDTTLILCHGEATRMPTRTDQWLAPRQLQRHLHLRPHLPRDWARVARVVSGNAVGLVLSGGGARGFAHLGVMRAMEEAGVNYDLVGGTSIGAAMGAFAAMDLPAQEAIAQARQVFRANPTGDFNWVPMLSLIGGKRLRQTIDASVEQSMGLNAGVEDLWKSYFCITSNYSAACETVLTRGPLARSIRASVSIPGALPPVMIDGQLHVDGGTFNNFPTDVMAAQGAARIIGVNLLREGSRTYKMDEVPGPWQLVMDRVRGKRHRLPGLVPLLLNTSIMASYARNAELRKLVDLYFAPGVWRYGLLDWSKFDRIVKAGYEQARDQLAADVSAAAAVRP